MGYFSLPLPSTTAFLAASGAFKTTKLRSIMPSADCRLVAAPPFVNHAKSSQHTQSRTTPTSRLSTPHVTLVPLYTPRGQPQRIRPDVAFRSAGPPPGRISGKPMPNLRPFRASSSPCPLPRASHNQPRRAHAPYTYPPTKTRSKSHLRLEPVKMSGLHPQILLKAPTSYVTLTVPPPTENC